MLAESVTRKSVLSDPLTLTGGSDKEKIANRSWPENHYLLHPIPFERFGLTHISEYQHRDQGNPYLRHDRIAAGSEKSFNLQILLDPLNSSF